MWQSLADRTEADDFVVLAIALDDPDAARPWIEASAPTYPCLIDRDHRTAELYRFTNVPQAVWIDEHGIVVRPPEDAGQTDAFRTIDRKTFAMPADALAERTRVKTLYYEAVADWAHRGSASRHVLGTDAMRARLRLPDAAVAEATALFRLGRVLLRDGRVDEAARWLAEASARDPASWAMWRQQADKDARGLASGDAFWARVEALGDRPYYRPPDLDG